MNVFFENIKWGAVYSKFARKLVIGRYSLIPIIMDFGAYLALIKICNRSLFSYVDRIFD